MNFDSDNLRVAISTGHGRLHLMQTANHVASRGVKIKLITGWVPTNPESGVLKLIAMFLGRASIIDGFRKRLSTAAAVPTVSLAASEFVCQGLLFCSRKIPLLKKDHAVFLGWQLFGLMTRKYLIDTDIFHVRSGAGRGNAIEKCKKQGIKVIVDHSIAHPAFFDRLVNPQLIKNGLPIDIAKDNYFWRMVIADCHNADVLMVNSDFVKNTFVDTGYPSEKIFVNYLGVRSDFIGLKTSYATDDIVRLLFTGSFEIRKGAEYLVVALEQLNALGFRYELTVVGTYQDSEKILAAAGSAGRQIKFVGHVPQEQLRTYLNEHDMFIFPSLAEGCASSAMEAMAAGLPVVATLESGLPITHLHNGYLVPSADAESIVQAVDKLTADAALRKKLGKNASDLIREKYTWDDYTRRLLSLYSDLS